MIKKIKLTKTSLSVFAILASAFFLRVYRINTLLGFYYDQGRDALVIWDFVYNGKFFLIGPTTGIEGVFRGPWYYWLVAPFYFIGGGNPVYPSVFLSFTTVVALYFLYTLAVKLGGKWAGFIAVIVGSFSHALVGSSRWLSNPTPMFLIGILFMWSLIKLVEGEKKYLYSSGLLAGLAMQFGSATEIFYIPLIIVAVILGNKKYSIRTFLSSLFLFVTPFVPQIIFDIRHQNILSRAIYNFLVERNSFKFTFWEIIKTRMLFYHQVIFEKFWPENNMIAGIFCLLIALILLLYWKKIVSDKKLLMVYIGFVTPFLGMIFFQGNEGNVYDYYFTGYYLTFVLAVSILFSFTFDKIVGIITAIFFLITFLIVNLSLIRRDYIDLNYQSESIVTLENQLQAIDWIYESASNSPFNVDVYVPPVIPYAYNYLFLWYGGRKYGRIPETNSTDLLYTLSEYDLNYPPRLNNWIKRQDDLGYIVDQTSFGLITVQKRERIKYE